MNAPARQGGESLGTLRAWGAAVLAPSDTARLDAELLLADAAGVPRAAVIAFPERTVDAAAAARFRAAVARRAAGEPLAYLVGRKEFYGLPLDVTPAVLVPRPETELVVEQALARLPPEAPCTVLDLGTGSGAIALAIASERPLAAVTAVDSSAAALEVARRNGERLGLVVRWIESDWFAALGDERFDVIVCNPPYVREDDPGLAGALAFEPRAALAAGADGLAAFAAVLDGAARHLAPGGELLLEHGHDQQEALAALARERGLAAVARYRDYAGHPRALALTAAPRVGAAVQPRLPRR